MFEHAMCDVARLPVLEVTSASHYIADLTLGLGESYSTISRTADLPLLKGTIPVSI
ncbi:hypothetical protein [Rhizobium mesoamericanum]|uniref:hypothetical protein n=1 Tax=Rhizobium mesoamericanum TaxID=1079800 RepID=UPI00352004AD